MQPLSKNDCIEHKNKLIRYVPEQMRSEVNETDPLYDAGRKKLIYCYYIISFLVVNQKPPYA